MRNPKHILRADRLYSSGTVASKGYTLIEILMTVLLIIVLIGMLLPIMSSTKDTAKMAVCTANMKQIYNAVIAEGMSRTSRIVFPKKHEWQSYTEAITEPEVLICPMDSTDHFKLPNNGIEFITPPPSVERGELESDNSIYVFREKESFVLTRDVELLSAAGPYGAGNDSLVEDFDSNDILAAGTVVDVFFFHFDAISDNAAEDNLGSTSMYLGSNDVVRGFIGRNDPGDYELNDTDSLLGLEDQGVVYEKHHGRRLEGATDRVTIPEGRDYIDYNSTHVNSQWLDEMRLITSPGSGSSYGMNAEIGQSMQNEHQIFITDANEPIIDFDAIDPANNSIWPDVLAPRHFGKNNVVYLDGSVELVEPEFLKPENALWRSGQ